MLGAGGATVARSEGEGGPTLQPGLPKTPEEGCLRCCILFQIHHAAITKISTRNSSRQCRNLDRSSLKLAGWTGTTWWNHSKDDHMGGATGHSRLFLKIFFFTHLNLVNPCYKYFRLLKVKIMCSWIVSVTCYYKFILYMCVKYIAFYYSVICVNYDMRRYLCV